MRHGPRRDYASRPVFAPRARGLSGRRAWATALAAGSLTTLTVLLATSPAQATPVSPPLEFEVRALETPVPGRPVPFEVAVTPRVEGERLRIRIVLPADAELTAGDSVLTVAPPAAGETGRYRFAVRIPSGARRHIYVRAELTTASGRVWTRGRNLVLLAGRSRVPEVTPRSVPDGKGGGGLIYDGAVVPTQGAPGARGPR